MSAKGRLEVLPRAGDGGLAGPPQHCSGFVRGLLRLCCGAAASMGAVRWRLRSARTGTQGAFVSGGYGDQRGAQAARLVLQSGVWDRGPAGERELKHRRRAHGAAPPSVRAFFGAVPQQRFVSVTLERFGARGSYPQRHGLRFVARGIREATEGTKPEGGIYAHRGPYQVNRW